MGKYRQLNFADRIYLEACHWDTGSEYTQRFGRIRELAWRLRVHRSTIYREIRRGSMGWTHLGYRADITEKRRRDLARRKGRPRKIVGELGSHVRDRLKEGWSPEQISARLRLEGRHFISHETIYRYVLEDRRAGGTLYLQLRHGHRRRKKRFSVPRVRTELLYRKSIEERSKVISERRRIGDWERDLMFGDSRKAALPTFVERRTGFVLLRRVSSKSPHEIASKTIEVLGPIRARQLCKSLTTTTL